MHCLKKEIEEWDFETKISDLNLSVENFTAVEVTLFEIKVRRSFNVQQVKRKFKYKPINFRFRGLDIDGRDEAI